VIYRFGEHAIDTDLLELRHNEDTVAVEPQVFQLIVHLIENRDRVVGKEALIETIWAGRVVSDATLNSRVNAARRALGDDGKAQAVIRTYPRRGFRFVADVVPGGAATHPAESAPQTVADAGDGHEKPLIAVLPFDNRSGDPGQEYFVDGITEDLITALSRFRWAFVIARNTSFTFKDRATDVRNVAESLGARYVVEGSVRKAGKRIRVTAQLIDAPLDRHLWAKQYDREIEDMFALQDEIAEKVATAIQPVLESTEIMRAERKAPESLEAWDHVMRGRSLTMYLEKEANARARAHFEQALESDPVYVPALTGLAVTHCQDVLFNWSAHPAESIATAREIAAQTARLNDNDAWIHCALGLALFLSKAPDDAIRHYRRALELNPSFAVAYGYLALQLAYAGEPEEAIEAAKRAMRLSPHDPEAFHFCIACSTAHYVAGRYEEALDWAREALRERQRVPAALRLVAAAHAQLNDLDTARSALDDVLAVTPQVTIGRIKSVFHFKRPGDLERYVEGLRKAGMPE